MSHSDPNMASKELKEERDIKWISLNDSSIRLSGFPFYRGEKVLGRIPPEKKELFEKVNPFINEFGANTAGGQISFRSDTTRVYLRVTTQLVHDMVNMTPAGQCGFDCYVGKNRQELKFVGVSRFDVRKKSYEIELAQYPTQGKMMEYLIHFPLYSGVYEVMLGIEGDAKIEKPESFRQQGGLVFYGTSITQGGCASRPGMSYTNMLSRKLNMEIYNFGLSANGLGEYEVADMLAEIQNPLLYVIDYEANAGLNGKLQASLKGFIQRIRNHHAVTPILVVSRLPYIRDVLDKAFGERRAELRRFQENTVKELQRQGDENIYFCDGSKLWGEDFDDYTVDTIHPTDLGFYMMVNNLLPVVKKILKM